MFRIRQQNDFKFKNNTNTISNEDREKQLLLKYGEKYKTYVKNVMRQQNPKIEYLANEGIYIDKELHDDRLKIPKKIFQVYLDKNIPPKIQKNIDMFKELNKDWEYKLFNEEEIIEYIQQNFPEYLSIYLKISPEYPAARCDFFRYLIIYNEGGVYLDSKSIINKPLSSIIHQYDEYILIYVGRSDFNFIEKMLDIKCNEFIQWFICSIPKHPFLYNVIKNVIYNIQNSNKKEFSYDIFKVTGPIIYTNSICELLGKYKSRIMYLDNTYNFTIKRVNVENYILLYNKKHYGNLLTPIIIN
jgi:mannosyltransferase OCH1-like enzyme